MPIAFKKITTTSLFLWMLWFGGALFLLPFCLDRQLVPRFAWIAAVLLWGLWAFRCQIGRGSWPLGVLDALLLAWYLLNVASIGWAFSWSEAVFYTQKVWLFLGAYAAFRCCLHRDESETLQRLYHATLSLSVVSAAVVAMEVATTVAKHGLDNQHLYDGVGLLFGNKSLSTVFLFFLLILNTFFYKFYKNKNIFWGLVVLITVLLLLLQTRTVYLAAAVALMVGIAGFWMGRRPRRLPRHWWAYAIGIVLVASVGVWKIGGTLVERLNPSAWLDSGTAAERRFVWYKTDLLNQEYPLLGVGNGSWKLKFPAHNLRGGYRLEELQVSFTRAHNDYLEIRSELGWAGILLFCALFLWVAWLGIRALRFNHAHVAALLAGLAGYGVVQYFDFPRERLEMQLWLALVFALLAHYGAPLGKQIPFKKPFIVIASIGLCFTGWIGIQRIRGEWHNVQLLEAASKGDNREVIRAAKAARNPFYEYDDVVLPLPWYEGSAWFALQNYPKAVSGFAEAYRLNPWSYQVINNYATALVQAAAKRDTNMLHQAAQLYKTAIELNPRHNDSKFNLSYTLFLLGDRAAALDRLRQIDTIATPKTPEQVGQNQTIKARLNEFRAFMGTEN